MEPRDEKLQLPIEDRLTDEQREKICAIDGLSIGAYPRAMCTLVALEMKPATEVDIFSWNDPPEKVRAVLEAAGLKVAEKLVDTKKNNVRLIIAQDEAVLIEMKGLSAEHDHRRYGELMGFSATMIDAFERKQGRLPDKERPQESAAQIFEVKLSKDGLADEMEVLRRWEQGIKRYAPETYKELVKSYQR